MTHINLLNTGIISSKRDAKRCKRDAGTSTFVVTGIARSGTSLVAGMLRDAGVFMGQFLHEVVEEDATVLDALHSRNMPLLRTIVADRNANHAQWGFKVPNLHAFLQHRELALFRNPHLIVIYRDPVAVTVRNALSEHFGELDGLAAATSAAYSMARFVQRAPCPVLLLSYEKALAFPNLLVDSVLEFCDLKVDTNVRNAMFLRVQPNREEYLLAARRSFRGSIDGVLDGQLYGWCAQETRTEPVRLELHVDGKLMDTFRADHYRPDLARNGVGNGNHAFFVDIERFALPPEALITVRIADRVLELTNSGKPLSALPVAVNV